MEFLIENFETIIVILTGILTVVGVIVKFTKNKTDDKIFEIIKNGFDFAKEKVTKEDLIKVDKKIKELKSKATSIKEIEEIKEVEKTTEKLKEIK